MFSSRLCHFQKRFYAKAIEPLSMDFFDKCAEVGLNHIRSDKSLYLVNLKRCPEGRHFFKFSEKFGGGRRCNFYFGAGADSLKFIQELDKVKTARDGEVFSTWTSQMFPFRSMTMVLKGHKILLIEEDLKTDKARKIHLDVELSERVKQCIQIQESKIPNEQ